ncbi:hypothetical protein [Actinomycetospora flava]|uniref:Uncharacterized protein n=1 Tax=Actinomycetospora flava TaxID=3129232 RepID=A0ABU8LZS8_9PSEU
MNIGQERRILQVEPIVDPVPERDFPDRPAPVRPLLPRPTPRAGAAPHPPRPAAAR